MRERESGHGPRHAGAEHGTARFRRVRLAVRAQKHVARRRGRRGLAVVDGDRFVAFGAMDHHEAAAADVAGARVGDSHRKAGGDSRVHRIAAARENVAADFCAAPLLRDHHAVGGEHGAELLGRRRCVGRPAAFLREGDRGQATKKQHHCGQCAALRQSFFHHGCLRKLRRCYTGFDRLRLGMPCERN